MHGELHRPETPLVLAAAGCWKSLTSGWVLSLGIGDRAGLKHCPRAGKNIKMPQK